MGATVAATDRGGDITYHGPGQLVGYPILTVPGKRGGGMADTAAYVEGLEQLLIDVLADLGVDAGRLARHNGVWIDVDGIRPRKIAAILRGRIESRSTHTPVHRGSRPASTPRSAKTSMSSCSMPST